jgi:hypothetical protein
LDAPPAEFHIFRPWWLTLLIPFAILVIGIVAVAWFAPLALLFTVPVYGVLLALLVTSNSGLILNRDGIAWYALHPRWRFRTIPWTKVHKTRRGFFGFGSFSVGPIMLTAEFDRYELWAWGKPRRDQYATIEIRAKWLVPGQPMQLWESIQYWRNQQDREAGTVVAASATE